MDIVENERALKLAKKYSPIIYQGWKSILDCITSIQLGDVKEVRKNLFREVEKPALYFGVREDNLFYYIYYMVYHPFDWSSSRIWLIQLLDTHRHDTEGILFRVQKNRLNGPLDICTMFHHQFIFEVHTDRRVVVESEGHGIKPYTKLKPKSNYLVYQKYKVFVNMNEFNRKEWRSLKREFGGAKMPDEHYDRAFPRGRRGHKKGDVWYHPDKVFEMAKKCRRF